MMYVRIGKRNKNFREITAMHFAPLNSNIVLSYFPRASCKRFRIIGKRQAIDASNARLARTRGKYEYLRRWLKVETGKNPILINGIRLARDICSYIQ